MKKVLIILFVVFTTSLFAQETHVNWQEDYEVAVKLAKKEKKAVLVFFTGSDWCGPCKMLVSDFFETEKFKSIADQNFILYEADFPKNKDLLTNKQRRKNYYLGGMYDVKSYPTVLILDSNGKKILGKRKGYNLMRDASYHYKLLNEAILKM